MVEPLISNQTTGVQSSLSAQRNKMNNDIKRIVHEHSGGMKFTELVSEMISLKQGRIDPDVLLGTVEAMDDVEVLRYSWHMTGEMSREKIFVYTP